MDTIQIIFLLVIAFVFGFLLGVPYGKFSLIKNALKSLSDRELQDLEKSLNQVESVVDNMVKVEIFDGMYYLYDTEDNFICQGKNLSEVKSKYNDIYKQEPLIMETTDFNNDTVKSVL